MWYLIIGCDAPESLARRLQSQVDARAEATAIVKLMCAHCASDGFLLELFLELLASVEHKDPIIHSIALAAVDALPASLREAGAYPRRVAMLK